MTDLADLDAGAARVLVVDDDPRIAELLVTTLRFAGFTPTAADTGTQALRLLGEHGAELVILDVMLPDIDGFDVARRLRRDGHRCPVLFLTARDATNDKVTGLVLGGDDYVTKPFSVAEVIARAHALLRRVRGDAPPALAYADLRMDDDTHEVRRGDRLIELSPTEYRLLRYLLQNAGRVVSKAQILERVWQYDFGGDAGVVEKFMSHLRKRVDVVDPPLLHTVRGFGYVLRTPAR
ncbi:response regulator transcription factor [Cryptosporangium aurantiacum]|uniref:Two-component system, OmpR family, response regulator n=1 Tax=Cryptosporangium aurantiacum TaxID=134849 RepID=A0A1M7MIN5_9ACTN|nr:response regulator transcription factor [Cryptosporangium aurantiacum]SHM90796.1 two-component system, OmpR family, response regulator [Cryptosporangium aurantiacum]